MGGDRSPSPGDAAASDPDRTPGGRLRDRIDRLGPRPTMALALVILSLGTGLGFLLAPLHPSAGYVAVTSMLAGPSAVGLWLRRHGVGEPVLDREGWRWLGAGAFLYLFSVSWSIELLMGMEYASGWEYPAYAVAFFVLVGTPWALGPEGRG